MLHRSGDYLILFRGILPLDLPACHLQMPHRIFVLPFPADACRYHLPFSAVTCQILPACLPADTGCLPALGPSTCLPATLPAICCRLELQVQVGTCWVELPACYRYSFQVPACLPAAPGWTCRLVVSFYRSGSTWAPFPPDSSPAFWVAVAIHHHWVPAFRYRWNFTTRLPFHSLPSAPFCLLPVSPAWACLHLPPTVTCRCLPYLPYRRTCHRTVLPASTGTPACLEWNFCR